MVKNPFVKVVYKTVEKEVPYDGLLAKDQLSLTELSRRWGIEDLNDVQRLARTINVESILRTYTTWLSPTRGSKVTANAWDFGGPFYTYDGLVPITAVEKWEENLREVHAADLTQQAVAGYLKRLKTPAKKKAKK